MPRQGLRRGRRARERSLLEGFFPGISSCYSAIGIVLAQANVNRSLVQVFIPLAARELTATKDD